MTIEECKAEIEKTKSPYRKIDLEKHLKKLIRQSKGDKYASRKTQN